MQSTKNSAIAMLTAGLLASNITTPSPALGSLVPPEIAAMYSRKPKGGKAGSVGAAKARKAKKATRKSKPKKRK